MSVSHSTHPALLALLTNQSQHFQKLRNECKQKFGEPGTAPTGTAAKGTPRAKPAASGAATTKGKAKASMKKGKASSSSSSKKRKERDEDMSDGSDEPVAKKVVKEEIEEPEELS